MRTGSGEVTFSKGSHSSPRALWVGFSHRPPKTKEQGGSSEKGRNPVSEPMARTGARPSAVGTGAIPATSRRRDRRGHGCASPSSGGWVHRSACAGTDGGFVGGLALTIVRGGDALQVPVPVTGVGLGRGARPSSWAHSSAVLELRRPWGCDAGASTVSGRDCGDVWCPFAERGWASDLPRGPDMTACGAPARPFLRAGQQAARATTGSGHRLCSRPTDGAHHPLERCGGQREHGCRTEAAPESHWLTMKPRRRSLGRRVLDGDDGSSSARGRGTCRRDTRGEGVCGTPDPTTMKTEEDRLHTTKLVVHRCRPVSPFTRREPNAGQSGSV